MCETLTATGLSFASEGSWAASSAAVSLWVVTAFHVLFLSFATYRDCQMRKQGWWKEEYFLTRDAAHAQALKIKLHVRFRALLCSAAHAIRAQEGLSWLSKLWGVQCVRTSAADRLYLTELDVQFMLLHMYQVTFATEESAWTRKRNADFLALQLKVQQAITTAYSDFVSRPSVCRRFCVLWGHLQPHISVQSYSLVTRCSLRACVVVANIFGRVALSVVYFLVIADSRARITAASCASAGERQYVDDVARGIFLQILFSCISRMLLLLWTAGMMLFHSREFKQDQEWDTESRRQQVVRWWIRDGVFAALILLYSVLCCTLGAAYIASASDEDGQRWLTSFATMVLLTALGEPLVKSLLCAVVAGASIKEDGGLRLQDCLAPELGAGPQKTGLSAITEVDEAPSPPDTALPISQRAVSRSDLLQSDSLKQIPGTAAGTPGASPIPSAKSSHSVASPPKPREVRESWRGARRPSDHRIDSTPVSPMQVGEVSPGSPMS